MLVLVPILIATLLIAITANGVVFAESNDNSTKSSIEPEVKKEKKQEEVKDKDKHEETKDEYKEESKPVETEKSKSNESSDVIGVKPQVKEEPKIEKPEYIGNKTTESESKTNDTGNVKSASIAQETVQGYHYQPYKTFDGKSSIKINDKSSLDLSQFTVAVWFKTTKNYVPEKNGGEGMMVTKGGWISDKRGEQLNYGIWVSDANHIRGGFEETNGADHIVTTSGTTFNDGTWHHAVIKYDGHFVKLYVDGKYFKGLTTSKSPEKNNIPLVIGKNPLSYRTGYFKGQLDEVFVWKVAISSEEVAALYNGQVPQKSKLVYSNTFGN